MEEVKKTDSNTKTQLSLAAALFFSPLVQNILKKNKRDINDQDRDFIHGYIKFGYITLLFGAIVIATGVLNYLFVLNFLSVIYTVSISILLFLLLISVVSILSDISLLKWWDYAIQLYTIEWDKKDIILKYLPLYNIYLWYKEHAFEKPNRWIKESIILWTIFVLICMSGSVLASSIVLIVIIVRVSALMSDIDFLKTQTKQQINKLFLKNPEEMRWYITGFLIYIGKRIFHLFFPLQPYMLREEINKEKEIYSRIINIEDDTHIIIEYILWILLMIWLIYISHIDFTVRTYYIWFGLLLIRYVIMAIQLKHIPHLPIAREILLLILRIWSLFKKKSFIPN